DLRLPRVDLGPELANDLSVDRDASLEDHLLTRAARANARMGQYFLQPLLETRFAAGFARGLRVRPLRGATALRRLSASSIVPPRRGLVSHAIPRFSRSAGVTQAAPAKVFRPRVGQTWRSAATSWPAQVFVAADLQVCRSGRRCLNVPES